MMEFPGKRLGDADLLLRKRRMGLMQLAKFESSHKDQWQGAAHTHNRKPRVQDIRCDRLAEVQDNWKLTRTPLLSFRGIELPLWVYLSSQR